MLRIMGKPVLREMLVAFALTALAAPAFCSDRSAFIERGVGRLLDGKPQDATGALFEARKLDTNEPVVHLALGAALLFSQRYEGAIGEFEQVLSLTQEPTARRVAWSGLGICWLRRGENLKAAQSLGSLSDTSDDSASAEACLAYALLRLGDRAGARRRAERAAASPEVRGFALDVIGRAQLENAPRTAIEPLRRALRESRAGQGRALLPEQAFLSAVTLPGARPASQPREMSISLSETDSEILQIEPLQMPANARQVALWIDGSPKGATNRPPFRFPLRRNGLLPGWHTAALEAYDGEGTLVGSAASGFRLGPEQPGAQTARMETERERVREVAQRLGPLVRPVSDPASLHYCLGRALEKTRALPAAAREYEAAFAVRSDQRDALERLLALYRATGVALKASPAPIVRAKRGVVALTFDDGPSPLFTPKLLDILKRRRVRATFFLVGMQVLSWPDLARRIADEGHELANHTFSHANVALLTPEQVQQEVLRAKVVIEQATGRATRLFRPPGGRLSPQAMRAVGEVGHYTVLWSSNILTGEEREPAALADRMARQLRNGGIALLHNGRDETLEVLPLLLAQLQKRGVQFATVSELLPRKTERRSFVRKR